VPDPDYRIPIVLLGSYIAGQIWNFFYLRYYSNPAFYNCFVGGASALVYNENLLAAAPLGFLGLLLLFQVLSK
jgi:hypothetical protein